MDKVNGKLTVYFEDPFWVGVFERIENGKLTVAKVTFGAEPKDYEIQEYIQKYYFSLNKQERKVRSREKREEDQLRMFELKQQKKREKHKGH